jgi:hypothetical protein
MSNSEVARSRIALCGWCRTQLPDTGDWMTDAVDVQHHFFVCHDLTADHSVKYVYLDRVESDFRRWVDTHTDVPADNRQSDR